MLRFEQAKDVIDYCAKLHHQIGEFYNDLSEEVSQERVRMLLTYLSRHEKHLEESLEEYEADASNKVMNTWLQFVPSSGIEASIKAFELNPSMSVDEVIDKTIEFDDSLIALYQEIINETSEPSVRAVFENLVAMENKEKIKMVRNAMMLKEI
jgi:rubrerythrin